MAMSSRGFIAEPDTKVQTRTKVSSEPRAKAAVAVVYYLCRNGQLDHPHFMEVTLSSHDGLYLRDVINRLNDLRGKGMATMYSWSCKRSYKNGFVWHDLSENDFIHPSHGRDYVLKGSEILDQNPRSFLESTSFRLPRSQDDGSPAIRRRRNQSWSSIDLSEYKVCRSESRGKSTRKLAVDSSTQTEECRRRGKPAKDEEIKRFPEEADENHTTELSRDEISPPPSDSSSETLECLRKADGRQIPCLLDGIGEGSDRTAEGFSSGRTKASSVLMQLFACGTASFRVFGPSMVEKKFSNLSGVKLEDREYLSGGLVKTRKDHVPSLKTSSSSHRNSRLQLTDEGVRAKCIPRKPKKEGSNNEACIENDTLVGHIGSSKRHEV